METTSQTSQAAAFMHHEPRARYVSRYCIKQYKGCGVTVESTTLSWHCVLLRGAVDCLGIPITSMGACVQYVAVVLACASLWLLWSF